MGKTWQWRLGTWAAILWLGMVAALPAFAARQDESSDQGAGTGSIIGYQPIPNSQLPSAAGSQPVSGQTAPAMQQQIAMQPAMPMTTQPQVGVPLGRGPVTGYDYTIWMVGQGPYTLGRDDMIQVAVRNQPDFSGTFAVGPDGSIQIGRAHV